MLYRKVSPKLSEIEIRKWLNTRYRKKTKMFYTKTKDELKEQFDAETIFFKFDDDCSGTLTVDELREVFNFFKIDINIDKIIEVFDLLDCDRSGSLTLDEFKTFQRNKVA